MKFVILEVFMNMNVSSFAFLCVYVIVTTENKVLVKSLMFLQEYVILCNLLDKNKLNLM